MTIKNLFAITVLAVLLFFFSCSKIEEKKNVIIEKTKNKATETSIKVWKKGVDKLFEFSTTIKPAKFEDIYGKNTGIEIKNESGKQIEYIGNFYNCFFKYNANIEDVLKFLDNLETSHPEISDEKYKVSDKYLIDEKLSFLETKFPDIISQIVFFTEFDKKKNLEYYSINKYPYSNIIIYDKLTNTIYHFVENYQE